MNFDAYKSECIKSVVEDNQHVKNDLEEDEQAHGPPCFYLGVKIWDEVCEAENVANYEQDEDFVHNNHLVVEFGFERL